MLVWSVAPAFYHDLWFRSLIIFIELLNLKIDGFVLSIGLLDAK